MRNDTTIPSLDQGLPTTTLVADHTIIVVVTWGASFVALTYSLGGREGSFGSPGMSFVIVGLDREGRGGGGALSYLYTVFGTAFMFNSTGRRPVSVCVCVLWHITMLILAIL